ncbi:MAG: hypothetical protein KAX95_06035 [Pseudomonas sp.]|nr:hypothetical protein [Pseudomonas sp.]
MTQPDDALRAQLRRSPNLSPRADLAAQIIRHATRQPQQHPWYWHVQRALDELSYGWPLKLASIALCGVLGVLAGQWPSTDADSELILTAQTFDNALDPELL